MTAPADDRYERRVAAVFETDLLSPMAARMAFPDFLQRFLPFPIDRFDRQAGFERALELSFRRQFGSDLLARSFKDLTPGSAGASPPYLLLNATWVETGEPIPVAPFTFLGEDTNWINTLQVLEPGFNPRASAAAGMSARFPIVSPAGYIRQGMVKHRYVDGGYIDNSAAVAVIQIFRDLIESNGGTWLLDSLHSHYILLHIANRPLCNSVRQAGEPAPSRRQLKACRHASQGPAAGGGGELLSPIRALIATGDAHMAFTMRMWEREVTRQQDDGQYASGKKIQMLERGVPIPLGWLLSSRATAELRSQLDDGGPSARCVGSYVQGNSCQLVELLSEVEATGPAGLGSAD